MVGKWYTTEHKRRRLRLAEVGDWGFVEHKVKGNSFEVYLQPQGIQYRLAPPEKVYKTVCLFDAVGYLRRSYVESK